MNLLQELKRRNVLRVAAAYVAVSWLLIQVVETLFPVFGLSDAAVRVVVIVLAIGFVPVLVITWVFELTPEGFIRDSEVNRDSAAARASGKRLDRIALVALALAVGYFAFDKFVLDPARDEAIADAAREEGRAAALQDARDSRPPVLAVLPFSAVTDTDDSIFFAAGVHDDLLTKLAQLPSMLVISRTSVLEYKDVQRNLREIGEALGADAILEGGVQSAGDRIRINAQLIDAKTDEHLWAQTYDRELTTASIFDVQDDIAREISEALDLTLSPPAQSSPVPTTSMPAYRAYHEAVTIREASHGGITSAEYRAALLRAIDLDPAFTRARALLVGSYALQAFGSDDPDLIARAEEGLEAIRRVAPNSADHLVAQTYYSYYVVKDYDLALQLAEQALEMVPSDTYLLGITGWIKRRQGDDEGHLESMYRARQLEPGDISWTRQIINKLVNMHRYDAALAEVEAIEGRLYYSEVLGLRIAVKDHGDLQRLARETQALADEVGDRYDDLDLWLTRILVRDFEGATEALDALLEVWHEPSEGSAPPGLGITNQLGIRIANTWLLGDAEKLAELTAEARAIINRQGTTDELRDKNAILAVALLAAVGGKAEETERRVRDWYQGGARDLASRGLWWDFACQMLGMAGAAEAAVECIRRGMEQPSLVMYFIEPHLPFYDPIRDEPVFVELVEELARR